MLKRISEGFGLNDETKKCMLFYPFFNIFSFTLLPDDPMELNFEVFLCELKLGDMENADSDVLNEFVNVLIMLCC